MYQIFHHYNLNHLVMFQDLSIQMYQLMDQIMMMDIQQQLLPPPPWYGVVAFLTIFFFTSLFRRCQSTSVSSTFLFSFLWVLTAQERLCRVLSYFQRGTLFPFRFGVKMTQKDATCTLLVLFLLLPPIMTEVKENPQQQVSGDKLTTGRLSNVTYSVLQMTSFNPTQQILTLGKYIWDISNAT